MIKHKHILYGHFTTSSIPPKIILWLISIGMVKKEWQAIALMFVVIIGCIILTIFNIMYAQEIWAYILH